MKIMLTLILTIALLSLFASCQSTSHQKQELSNKERRNEIMHVIANDSMRSKEMIGTLMNSKNGLMMQEHQTVMMGNESSILRSKS